MLGTDSSWGDWIALSLVIAFGPFVILAAFRPDVAMRFARSAAKTARGIRERIIHG